MIATKVNILTSGEFPAMFLVTRETTHYLLCNFKMLAKPAISFLSSLTVFVLGHSHREQNSYDSGNVENRALLGKSKVNL